ncbi:fructose-2,6-bisphosphatase [Prauserella sp. Am3]|nr:fructose-2,6-bisphosphatase [Prauserella sp. Am3]
MNEGGETDEREVRLLLVRHGETTWHADNRYAGSSDVGLTARGHRQAAALARWAASCHSRPAAVYCSPQSRAIDTARPVAAALGTQPAVVPELAEAHFGIAEGHTLGELPADVAARFRADPVAHAFPEAEPPAVVAERGAGALRHVAARHRATGSDAPALVVAHNTLLRLSLCLLFGIPLSTYRRVLPRLDNAAVTEIGIHAGHASLRRLNAAVR